MFTMIQCRSTWLNSVKFALMTDCDSCCIWIMLYHEHTNIWLTVYFLLWNLLCGTPYQLNVTAYPCTSCFVVALKHFYLLSFILHHSIFLSLSYCEARM